MSDVNSQPIVVGVSEDGQSEGALRFAVDEAIRQRCNLTIIHALSQSLPPPPPPGDPLIGYGRQDYGRQDEKFRFFADRSESAAADRLVTDVARRARAMSRGRVAVDTDIPVGRRVHAIIEAAGNARLIVLQHRDLPAFERIFVHSTSIGVSARARCPVVTVPPVWESDLHHCRITVAIDDIENSAAVLRVAFECAMRRVARIDVVHAWRFTGAEADICASRDLAKDWEARSKETFEKALAPWQREFPQVKVEQHLVQQSIVDALLERSRGSDLLILGRFRASLPLPFPLGSIARAMVNGAHCPVEIVPHGASTTSKPTSGTDERHRRRIEYENEVN